MLNLISRGDVDTGLVKRYICDSKEDFKELPIVYPGSTVLIQTTGEIYMINENGEWVFHTTISTEGKPGYTPVKGVDYFTDADKTELTEEVLNKVVEAKWQNISTV